MAVVWADRDDATLAIVGAIALGTSRRGDRRRDRLGPSEHRSWAAALLAVGTTPATDAQSVAPDGPGDQRAASIAVGRPSAHVARVVGERGVEPPRPSRDTSS